MRNILKAATVESKLPLLSVEHGCIVSKDADITVVFRVELPELFTVTSAEYEGIHAAWCKAVRVLPQYSIVTKQDWFIREKYVSELNDGNMSFLSRSYERHFNERPFLNHACYLYLTKTTKERIRMQSNFSTLCRGNIIPKEVNAEATKGFLEAVEQFEHILNDSGFIRLCRLSADEITGTFQRPGLLEQYLSLSFSDTASLEDIGLDAEGIRIGRQARMPAYTLGYGRPAGPRGYGYALRAPFDRPFGLSALLRRSRRAAPLLRPHLHAGTVSGGQRGKPPPV